MPARKLCFHAAWGYNVISEDEVPDILNEKPLFKRTKVMEGICQTAFGWGDCLLKSNNIIV